VTERAAAPHADPADAAALCTSCGLCCTGVLFNGAPAADGEERKLRGYGMELREVEGRLHFIFPCPHLEIHGDGHDGAPTAPSLPPGSVGGDRAGGRHAVLIGRRPTPDTARLWVEGMALDTFLDRKFRTRKVLGWAKDEDTDAATK